MKNLTPNKNYSSNTKVWADLPEDQHIYLFRKIFAGDRGVKQQLILDFFDALYQECLTQGIPGEWSLDHGKAVGKIMSKINFRGRNRANKPTKSGRTSGSSSESQAQSTSGPDDSGPTH